MKARNGIKIPDIGFGTASSIQKSENPVAIISDAIRSGYQFIDTAWVYNTESSVGKAIQGGGVDRKELFIQTKFYPQMPYDYDSVMYQFEDSISRLGLEYIDSYLIHQPVPRYSELEYKKRNSEAWKAIEQLYKDRRVLVIGVSNFLERHIEYLVEDAEVFPMINQLEINPFFQQIGLSEWCKNHGMVVQAWGSLAKGNAINFEPIKEMANKYHVTTAQFCLKWNMQMGNVPIVSSSKPENISSNLELNFSILDEDMELIRGYNTSTNHRDTWWYPRQQMY